CARGGIITTVVGYFDYW
nr:immunoglobulin heavy chain junction region [Mus musculus]